MMPAIKKTFELMGDDIVELSTENKSSKNKKSYFDEVWLEESKTNLKKKQIDDEKRANSILSRMQKWMKMHQIIGI